MGSGNWNSQITVGDWSQCVSFWVNLFGTTRTQLQNPLTVEMFLSCSQGWNTGPNHHLFNIEHVVRLMLIWRIVSPPVRRGPAKVRRRSSRKTKSKSPAFDVKLFLESAGLGRKVENYRRKQTLFAQGDPATNVMYIQEGGVKLGVVNETGKEAVLAILGPGDFVGKGCLAGQAIRRATATAIAPTTVLVVEKDEMIRMLHREHDFSDRFIAHMLRRNIRVEEDLVDQLFNSTEKRLARTLLLLARYGTPDQPQAVLSKISQEMLAEMIGTTRSRVNLFMNKFKKLGFIQYNKHEIKINDALLSVVLHE
jgi:CRP/FNR family transcriptional regulator, cyclic AMP receptor protein